MEWFEIIYLIGMFISFCLFYALLSHDGHGEFGVFGTAFCILIISMIWPVLVILFSFLFIVFLVVYLLEIILNKIFDRR